MSSSERPMHRLVVEAPEPGLGVLVIDAEGHIVARCADGQSRIEVDLPRGLYTVRSTRSGAFAETDLRLDNPKTVEATMPPMFSASTIPGGVTTHEYHTYPAWEASQIPTGPEQAWNGAADAGLLLFTRAPKKMLRYDLSPQGPVYVGEDQFVKLSLRTLDGRTLSRFEADAKHNINGAGSSAYSAKLSHGLLILEDQGEFPRQIPVPLMRGWQTQLFVMHDKRLLWEDLRLAMVTEDALASRKYRNPFDESAEDVRAAQDMDAGLLALQNDAPSVAPQLIDAFLGSKFQNPILGLLGAYLMLMHERRKARDSDYRVDIEHIRIVLDNLHALLFESADVVALRLLAEPWLGKPTLAPVTRIPMFRYGAEVLLKEAASDLSLVPEGSLLDLVSDRLYGDTVWTTWKPISLPLGRRASSTLPDEVPREPNWVEYAVVDAISAARDREDGVPTDDLLRRIGVSPHAVREAMHHLISRAGTQQFLTDLTPQDMRLIGGQVLRKLADKLGTRIDESLLERISIGTASVESANRTPRIQQVYFRLKKALSEVAGTQAGKISADSVLTEIIRPNDALGRTLLSKRLTRQFREQNIELSDKEIDTAGSVRDLAHILLRKLSE